MNLENLEKVFLSDNEFEEEIPAEMETLDNLNILMLRDNKLRGTITEENIGNQTSLTVLDISGNNFTIGDKAFSKLLQLRSLSINFSTPITLKASMFATDGAPINLWINKNAKGPEALNTRLGDIECYDPARSSVNRWHACKFSPSGTLIPKT